MEIETEMMTGVGGETAIGIETGIGIAVTRTTLFIGGRDIR